MVRDELLTGVDKVTITVKVHPCIEEAIATRAYDEGSITSRHQRQICKDAFLIIRRPTQVIARGSGVAALSYLIVHQQTNTNGGR